MGDMLSFSPSGRTSRRHYWAGLILLFIAVTAVEEAEKLLYGITIREALFNALTAALSLAELLCVWLALMSLARRFHDIDRTGWWALAVFIPFFIPFGAVIVGCLRGSDGANRYGPAPGAKRTEGTPEETARLLNELAHLKDAGAVTPEEYEAQKKRLLKGA